MLLDGRRVERATIEDVSDEAGDLALRHGWAEKVPEKAKKSKEAENE